MRYLFVFSLAFLTGCGTVDAYRSIAADKTADAADQSLETGMWLTCEGASVGAIMRRYPTTDEQVAHLERCAKEAAR